MPDPPTPPKGRLTLKDPPLASLTVAMPEEVPSSTVRT